MSSLLPLSPATSAAPPPTPAVPEGSIPDRAKPAVQEEEKESEPAAAEQQLVTPYLVRAGAGGVDYGKLVRDFGAEYITPALVARVERITGRPAHPLLRRGIFFSHRDLSRMLDTVEAGGRFYLYTGRGPSSDALHIGHLIPFLFTRYLQEAFGAALVVQLTDDEKFFWKQHLDLNDTHALAYENAKDIIALGFDPHNTFIFTNLDYIGTLYPNVCRIQKCVTVSQAKGIFGFNDSDNCGRIAFPAIQAAPAFSSSFPHLFGKDSNVPCLVPCAIDQVSIRGRARHTHKQHSPQPTACSLLCN